MALNVKKEPVKVRKSSMFLEFCQRLTKSWSAKIGLFLMLFIILACVIRSEENYRKYNHQKVQF